LNEEEEIEACLKSLRKQKFEGKYEIILVDGFSRDHRVERAKPYVDKICKKKAHGPGAARNEGAAFAMYDILAFIDADYVWLPGKLEAQLGAFARLPQAAVAYCWTDYVDAAGNFVCPDSRSPLKVGCTNSCSCTISLTVAPALLRAGNTLAVGCFDDAWLQSRLGCLSRLAALPFVCVHRPGEIRQSPSSLTTRILLMETSYWRVINRAFADAPASYNTSGRGIALFYSTLPARRLGCPSRQNG
jgi:glycosyltransferase involved in cell wall biosynthesis